jgi:formylglycine-generating enzyme required for sulfatase activity
MSMVTVGDVGNAADTTSYGAVSYYYQIGTYEVTGSQYTAFLNAVGSTDTYGLYNTSLGTDTKVAQIRRSGTTGTYTYAVMNSTGHRPISYVSWFDSARFSNWLANGQPSGAQTSTTTENGAYNLNGATSGNAVAANATNPNTGLAPTYRMPLENEWYKAAYYSPNYSGTGVGGYWTWATQSNSAPGTTIGSSPNQASYDVYAAATDVGSFSGSGSFYGTFDQTGNVWEWNDLNGIAGSDRGIRGGMWEYNSADVSSSTRMDYEPDNEDDDVGFRVASPVTLGATGPGGGKVFYKHASGTFACGATLSQNCTYLEVAPNTWSGGSADPSKVWAVSANQMVDVPSITNDSSAYNNASGIGLGYKNSLAIVAQGNGTTTAAGAARAYSGGSQSDWYLPSTAELNLLCQWARNVPQSVTTPCTGGTLNTGTGAGGGFSTGTYWSSSEFVQFAWIQDFALPYQEPEVKGFSFSVRPVRAF